MWMRMGRFGGIVVDGGYKTGRIVCFRYTISVGDGMDSTCVLRYDR